MSNIKLVISSFLIAHCIDSMIDCCFIVSGVFDSSRYIQSRCENESETEDEDQRHRRQEEYLTNYDHVKYKISEDLISGYKQARQASPTMIKSYDFKCFPLIICMLFQCLLSIDRVILSAALPLKLYIMIHCS